MVNKRMARIIFLKFLNTNIKKRVKITQKNRLKKR